MDLTLIKWEPFAAAGSIIWGFYIFFRNIKRDNRENLSSFKNDVKELFFILKNDINEVKSEIREIKSEISDIKERITFLESAALYTMPLEPSQPNPRSQAAKAMWNKRRQKKIDSKA